MNRIKYSDIVNILNANNININSTSIFKDDLVFDKISSLADANENDITFFSNIKYIDLLKTTKAKICIIKNDYINHLPTNCSPLIVNDPYLVFAILTDFVDKNKISSNGIISENTYLDKTSKLHENIQINNFAVVNKNTEIFENVIIGANSNIGPNAIINKNCIIHNNVSISNAIIGNNCEIKPGAIIGSAGFGFEEKTKKKINHIGNVIIKNNSTIGSNVTIDRAVLDSTIIGEYSQIDNLVQIAHNVIIGNHAIIAAQVGIAGSTVIGNYVKIGGQAGISGHIKIGNNVTIAGKSGVTKNIPDNKIIAGFPAKDINIWKREIIKMSKLK